MRYLDVCRSRFNGCARWVPGTSSLVATLAVLAGMWSTDPAVASAQWWRGQMRQIMIQTAKATQQMVEEAQKRQEAEEQAFMERFDTNHDGKITGKEKGPAKKYLRQKELGLDPDAKIKNQKQATMKLGKSRRSKSTRSTKSSKAAKESKELKDSDDSKESNDEKDSSDEKDSKE